MNELQSIAKDELDSEKPFLNKLANFVLNTEEWEDTDTPGIQKKVKTLKDVVTNAESYKRVPKYSIENVPKFVPEQFKDKIVEYANQFDYDPSLASALLHTENTPWNPELKNPKKGSTATGLGQHTDAFYRDYNRKFKKVFNRDYDRNNAEDAIAATFLALSDLKDRTGGITESIKAYHAGVKGMVGKYAKEADEYYKKVMSWIAENVDKQ